MVAGQVPKNSRISAAPQTVNMVNPPCVDHSQEKIEVFHVHLKILTPLGFCWQIHKSHGLFATLLFPRFAEIPLVAW